MTATLDFQNRPPDSRREQFPGRRGAPDGDETVETDIGVDFNAP